MRPKIVYWKRFNYRESGFDLAEIFEDGKLVIRKFINHKNDEQYYEEVDVKTIDLQGEIRIEKVEFGNEDFLSKTDLLKRISVTETFDIAEWETARETIRQLQKDTIDQLDIDYHSMLVLDENLFPEEVRAQFERFDYPIVKFRFNFDKEKIKRLEYPEKISIEFIPELNEKLYFHHFPQNNLLTMTGDDLFALHTEYHEEKITDETFLDYIFKMTDNIAKNKRYYRELVNKQRERRAMLETDIIGDLYPR